jgi:hypothetical protein
VKREVFICLAIIGAALLANAGTRYYAALREAWSARPPVVGEPERSPGTGSADPESTSINFSPRSVSPPGRDVRGHEPPLRGDLLVLILQTRPAREADAWLAEELEGFHTQHGHKERFL